VRRALVTRLAASHDRRRLRLRLTATGTKALRTALAAAEVVLEARFSDLPPAERGRVVRAMARLRPLL